MTGTSDRERHSAGDGLPSAAGAVNWVGLQTLYMREVRRFIKVFTQTLMAPVVTTLLFLAVFALALGGAGRAVAGVEFVTFLTPGLIVMAIAQQSFMNTSSSIVIAKVQGNIVDTLMPPLSPTELVVGYALSGATRGVLVGVLATIAMGFFVEIDILRWGVVLFHGAAAALMMALMGLAAGVWAEKFDHIAFVTNFIVTPLTFLSGAFYSTARLPETARDLAHLNPFFYMIDGFRYGFIDHADGSIAIGLAVVTGAVIALWGLCVWMFKTGYKLKA